MLMRHTTAYSSSCSRLYWSICPSISYLEPLFWGFEVTQDHRCRYH